MKTSHATQTPNGGSLHPVVRPRQGEWVTLEQLKRYKSLKNKWRYKLVRIYSEKHQAYWVKNGFGYTTNLTEALVTGFEHALEMTRLADMDKRIKYQAA